MGVLSTGMLEHLETDDKEVVIVDTAAGIEHFGRGVEQECDILLVVLDPTFESLMLSKNIPANNDVFRACLAGEELDLRLAEIDELANVLGGEKEKNEKEKCCSCIGTGDTSVQCFRLNNSCCECRESSKICR